MDQISMKTSRELLSDEEFFASNATIQSILAQPENVQFIPSCRLSREEAAAIHCHDQLFHTSLRNPDLVPYATAFYEDPFTTPLQHTNTDDSIGAAKQNNGPHLLIRKSTLVLAVQPGTNGFNGTVHGGLITALIDEAMGSLIFINHQIYSALPSSTREALQGQVVDMQGLAMFTAQMNVSFRRPIPTPGVVLVEARAGRVEGRKVFIEVAVKGEDGAVHATCDGMWMSVRREAKL